MFFHLQVHMQMENHYSSVYKGALYKESCKQKSIAEIKKSRKNCATEKGHDKTSWRKSFASRDKASI